MASTESYVCTVCGYVYDPALGDGENGIAAGLAFVDVPENWVCPICGVSKAYFKELPDASNESQSETEKEGIE